MNAGRGRGSLINLARGPHAAGKWVRVAVDGGMEETRKLVGVSCAVRGPGQSLSHG